MNTELLRKYKGTTLRIGFTLLFFLLILNVNMITVELFDMFKLQDAEQPGAEISYQLIYGGAYLLSFMLPVAFFYLISKNRGAERIKFTPTIPKYLIFWIFAGVGCVSAMAIVNSAIIEPFFNVPDVMLIDTPETPPAAYVIVLEYIVTALVPAFCEEFLFRGAILTNLLPYGKTTAIIGSAVLFSLMHQNPWQTLYTFCAGIVMGVVYVYSGSIWPSILVHLANNQLSVFGSVFFYQLDEATANKLYYMLEILLIFAGIISAVVLAIKLSRERMADVRYTGAVGRKLSYIDDGAAELTSKEAVRYFFSPTIIVFAALTAVMWILILVLPI